MDCSSLFVSISSVECDNRWCWTSQARSHHIETAEMELPCRLSLTQNCLVCTGSNGLACLGRSEMQFSAADLRVYSRTASTRITIESWICV